MLSTVAAGAASGSSEIVMTTESESRDIRGACPLDCPDTCSWIVTIKNGEAISLRGDPAHPYTRGSLCHKVADNPSRTVPSDATCVVVVPGISERTYWEPCFPTHGSHFGILQPERLHFEVSYFMISKV
jgi:hypothetical protein